MAQPKTLPRPNDAWPWEANVGVVYALKALEKGEASPEQQQIALEAVIKALSGYYELSYFNTDRDTAFMEGRRFVGAQIVGMLNLRSDLIERTLKKQKPA